MEKPTGEPDGGKETPMEKGLKLYMKLFTSTFMISAFTVGGGYVIVPLLQKKFVDDLKWIDKQEMLDYVAIGQSSPGPIAINTSILIGYRMAGIPGALVTMLGTVLPPFLIITIISFFYEAFINNQIVAAVLKGMRSGVAAVIADVIITMALPYIKKKDWISIAIMVAVFIAAQFFNINLALIIVICGLGGAIAYLVGKRLHKDEEGCQAK